MNLLRQSSGNHWWSESTGVCTLAGWLGLCITAVTAETSTAASQPAAILSSQHPSTVRFATFNVCELSSTKLDEQDEQGRGSNTQLRKAAEIIQRVHPDVLLINEIDFDAAKRQNARHFVERYLYHRQGDQAGIDYPHVFVAPVNTGIPSGHDLDNNGRTDGPADAWGFGQYPGQYGMALLSRYPIDVDAARTFQKLLWKQVPNHLMPDGSGGKPVFYSPQECVAFPLSSKSHWDVPVCIGSTTVHVLASHPTPPIFDGPEDRNGRRNFDEIRFWADYLTGGTAAAHIVDDRGRAGGLDPEASFVVMGDLNADPVRDPAPYGKPAIRWLLDHPRVQNPCPKSLGSDADPGDYPGDRATRTCEFGRIDYVLPSKGLRVKDAGVFWPAPNEPGRILVTPPSAASDHHLVWVDVTLPKDNTTATR